MQIKNTKTWLVLILIASVLTLMLMITKHYNEEAELQQKIYDHSEIKDTVESNAD
jgi:hypothetical protein